MSHEDRKIELDADQYDLIVQASQVAGMDVERYVNLAVRETLARGYGQPDSATANEKVMAALRASIAENRTVYERLAK